MAGKRGMIIPNNWASLRSRYCIPDYVELLVPAEGVTLRNHHEGCIYLNEWMFKAGVQIPFDFDILELLHIFGAAPIQVLPNSWSIIQSVLWFCEKRNTKIVLNLPDSVPEWKLRIFYALFKEVQGAVRSWGVPLQWNNELLEVRNVMPEELEWGQRAALEEPSSDGIRALSFLEFQPLLLGENHRGVHMERHQAPRRAIGPTALNKEAQERLARQEEEDLQASLALSREEVCRSSLFVTSPEASVDPASLGSAPPHVLVMDIGADTTSLTPIFELETPKAPGREGIEADTAEA
ncbi:hypothetical protein ACLOJK_037399 [Asimina triloba]